VLVGADGQGAADEVRALAHPGQSEPLARRVGIKAGAIVLNFEPKMPTGYREGHAHRACMSVLGHVR